MTVSASAVPATFKMTAIVEDYSMSKDFAFYRHNLEFNQIKQIEIVKENREQEYEK